MQTDIASFINSFISSPITILILGLLVSLYLIFHVSKGLDIDYIKYFDKFFKIVIFGLIISRLIFMMLNLPLFSNLNWSILPQIRTENLYTYEVTKTWSLQVLPWVFWDFASGINPAGFLFAFIIFLIDSKKKFQKNSIKSGYKYFAYKRVLTLPVITFIIFVMYSMFLKYGANDFFSKFYDLDILIILLMIVILVILYLIARNEKIEFDKMVRNSSRETADVDILKETAEQVRKERLLKSGIKNIGKIDVTLKSNFEKVVGKILNFRKQKD